MHFSFAKQLNQLGQDGALLPDDQPIKLRESRAGRAAINKKSFCTFEDTDLRESHAKLHNKTD